jgi:hypothetical protein
MTDNWTKKRVSNGTRWIHNSNHRVTVELYRLEDPKRLWVYHHHPAPYGRVVLQDPEIFKELKGAMKSVEMHLKHWNDPKKWKTDPDYGKLTNKP